MCWLGNDVLEGWTVAAFADGIDKTGLVYGTVCEDGNFDS